jgi:hypothetical protein
MTTALPTRNRIGQWILSPPALALFLAIAIVTSFTLTVPARDSLAYWTAGHELLHRANPYASDKVQLLERAAGFHGPRGTLVMLNPPSTLPLTLPFGLFGFRFAGLLWSLSLLGCLIASVRIVWTLHGRPQNQLHLLGYSFAPAVICVFAGQIPLFALLGLTLFLRLHRTQPFSAGAALCLCAVKPHLFIPLGLVLIAWTLMTRRYRVLIGAAVTFAAINAFVILLDPPVWTQYREFMHSVSGMMGVEFIPCLSVVLRRAINPRAFWIQGIPEALGCIWALWYFWKHRRTWDWMDHGALLMLVSVFVAPYAWLIDQSVLIPALMHGLYRSRSRSFSILLATASALVFLQTVLVAGVHSPWNLWPAPFWLLLYIWFTRSAPAPNEDAALSAGRQATLANS